MKYRKQIHLGYGRDGRQIRKWISADSKTELKKKIEQFREEYHRTPNPSDVTFQKYSENWLTVYKKNRAKQTIDMYRNALRKCTELDPFPVRKITRSMCQEVINESWSHPSAAANIRLTLKQIFKTAIADGIIAVNPAEALSLPKKPESRFYLLTAEDLEKVKNAPLNDQDRLFVTVLQVFGLRPAEALALQPTDFDFDEGVLHITKSLELTNDNESTIKSTKTGVSRDIPIPEELSTSLKAQIRQNKAFYLFSKRDNSLYTKSAYRRLSERIMKACGLPDQATLYSFRHRRATDLYYLTQTAGSGVTTKFASQILGHSELVFLSTYSHVDDSQESKNIYRNFDFDQVKNW